MSAQAQQHRSVVGDSISRSSARAPTVRPHAQFPPTVAEDRSTPAEDRQQAKGPRRVDPLWMITAAAAALFVFLAVAVAFD